MTTSAAVTAEHRQRDHHQDQDAAATRAQRVAPGHPQRRPPGRRAAHRLIPGSRRCVDRVGAGLVDDDAVAQEDDAVGPGGVPRLVGDEHAGRAGVAAGPQQPQDLLAGVGVEGAGRLVGEDQPAVADDGAGDRDPLLLAAGHLVGEPVGELADADLLERRAAPPCGRRADALAVELARQRDVLGRGQRGDQVEVLEDVADRRTPHPGAALVAERAEVDALDADRAGGRLVEPAGQGEQGRLAGAGRAHDRDQLAGVGAERDATAAR